MMRESLAGDGFWDAYWRNLKVPAVIDEKFSFERCLAAYLRAVLAREPGGTALEIGCAPGKWMMFFERCGYEVSGLEKCAAAVEKTVENLGICGSGCRAYAGDFFEEPLKAQFDLVYSLGFIEHFSDPFPVLDGHVRLLKRGGLLIAGVPNFRGINRLFQRIAGARTLEAHNLDCMTPLFFERYARSRGLEVLGTEYIGSFEPALFIFEGGGILKTALRKLASLCSRLRNPSSFIDRLNAGPFSSYVISVMRKRRDCY